MSGMSGLIGFFIGRRADGTLSDLMDLFRRLHDRCEPPGLELTILRQLPKALLVSTLLPLALSLLVRLLPAPAGIDIAKRIMSVDIFSVAAAITLWTAVFTVAIGCIVVFVLKGPAYVADAYPIDDSPHPRGK